jgi:hypothetical protein
MTNSIVKREMEAKINEALSILPMDSRVEAAKWLLSNKEGWYKQTPEGEYLVAVTKEVV